MLNYVVFSVIVLANLVMAFMVGYYFRATRVLLFYKDSPLNRKIAQDETASKTLSSRFFPSILLPTAYLYEFSCLLHTLTFWSSQTIGSIMLRSKSPVRDFKEGDKVRIPSKDGNNVVLSLFGTDNKGSVTILLNPGLGGSSYSLYIRWFVKYTVEEKGYRCVVLNPRGCGPAKWEGGMIPHAGFTDDIELAVEYCKDKFNTGVVLVGFSMGANQVVKYLAVHKGVIKDTVSCAVSVSNPFLLYDCLIALRRGGFIKAFADGLVSYGRKHKEVIQELFERKGIDENVEEILGTITNPMEFDDKITSKLVGYKDAKEYLQTESCSGYLKRVQIPLLILHSADDPISISSALPYEIIKKNDNVMLCLTAGGGHLGWLRGIRFWRNYSFQEIAAHDYIGAVLGLKRD